MTILLVDTFDILSDHNLDAGTPLSIRRLLPARPLPSPLAAHSRHESALFYVAALDGNFAPAFQSSVGKLAQRLIEEKTDVRGSDFVGGDVVAQLGIVLRILSVPRQILTC